MGKQIREVNQEKKARIKELEKEIEKLKGATEELFAQGKKQAEELNQKIAQNNTLILRKEGAVDELKRQVK